MKMAFAFILVTTLLCGLGIPAAAANLQTPAIEIIVNDMTNRWAYRSADGGVTWLNNAKPPAYISLEHITMSVNEPYIFFSVHNNTAAGLDVDSYYTAKRWDGSAWISIPGYDRAGIPSAGLRIAPGDSAELYAWLSTEEGNDLPSGVYKLVKTIHADGRELICDAVFTLGKQTAPALTEPVIPAAPAASAASAPPAASTAPDSASPDIPAENGLEVKDLINRWAYRSADGGRTWLNDAVPPLFLTLDRTSVPHGDGMIPYTVRNTTGIAYLTGRHYNIMKWVGEIWVTILALDEAAFAGEGYGVPAGGALKLNAQWDWNGQGIGLSAGLYKLEKIIRTPDFELSCEAVFTLT